MPRQKGRRTCHPLRTEPEDRRRAISALPGTDPDSRGCPPCCKDQTLLTRFIDRVAARGAAARRRLPVPSSKAGSLREDELELGSRATGDERPNQRQRVLVEIRLKKCPIFYYII